MYILNCPFPNVNTGYNSYCLGNLWRWLAASLSQAVFNLAEALLCCVIEEIHSVLVKSIGGYNNFNSISLF